jgi:hypothetical protein
VCRAAGGVCDVVEICDGSSDTCPADAKSTAVCRAATGICDVTETCDGSTDDCPADVLQPNGTSCSDTLYCNGAETCQAGACVDNPDPCVLCDEVYNTCLNDLCPLAPQAGCRHSAKSVLIIKNKDDDSADRLTWKMIRAEATSFAELSDPTSSASYALCLYAGTTGTLVMEMGVPPGPAWTVLGADKGYKYDDPPAIADGAQKMTLKAASTDKAKLIVRGRGVNLGDPLINPLLPLPVTAQLTNFDTGVCWETSYATPLRNSPSSFKAKE